jgi:MFS transporter, AAHS family, 4-hydroxybenzoate transporter
MTTIDVGSVLDEGQWSSYQKLLVVATALTIILDGVDNQLIGAAVPSLMKEWGLPRAAFAPLFATGMIGMMIGGFIGGMLGDRFGRRAALLGSVISFGALTVLVSLAGGFLTLAVLRFFAGLGLGGAMPNAAALSSEYVPRRRRPFAVTMTIVCIPLGGTLAGLMGSEILPRFGWRALFLVGGVVPLVLAAVLLKILPESPRYLARHRERWHELGVLLHRLGHRVPEDAAFMDPAEKVVERVSVRELLVPEFRRDTLALCGSFFFCLLSVYVGTQWVPSMLTGARFDVATANRGLLMFNLGGVVGAILGAILFARLGSRLTMLTMTAGAVGGAAVMASMSIEPRAAFAILAMLAWTGGLIDVRAGGERLSDGRPGHRRRHGGGVRAHRWCGQHLCRKLGARVGRPVRAVRFHRRDDVGGVRCARVREASHPARARRSRRGADRRRTGSPLNGLCLS